MNIQKLIDIESALDEEEKLTKVNSIGVESSIQIKNCLSTGLLCIDLTIGGGLRPGAVYEIVGPEHAGKTTLLHSIIGQALKIIPHHTQGLFEDAEGKVDPVWASHIYNCNDITDIFGVKDEDTSKWIKTPRIRYYKPQSGDKGLIFLRKAINRLPDKVLIGSNYYYMWSAKEPKVVKKTGGYTATMLKSKLGDAYSKKMLTKYGNFYVPIPNNYSGPELIIGIDSWAAMVPEAIVDDDSNAMGGPARMFAKHLNTIKAGVTAKGLILLGINQVREKPMSFGPSEYFPGGNTLKHMTDCRIRVQSISNQNGSGQVEEEDSDIYRHFNIRIVKNKLWIPYKKCYGRWWVEHDGESGFGPDIVLDTLNYLKMTGQFRGRKKGFQIKMSGKKKILKKLTGQTFNYDDFKHSILNPKEKGVIDIRGLCYKQLRSGKGNKLFLKGDIE